MSYAGFWKRFAAYLIDGILIGAVCVIVMMVFGVGLAGFASMNAEDMQYMSEEEQAAMAAGIFGGMMLVGLIFFVLQWLYFALMESSSKQATLGKMALGIVVTDMNGNRISFGRATGRYFGKILSGLIIYIGYIMVAFTEKKQGLHDMMASCLVLNK
ncbi:MAG: RDD family protein [Ignavibacteriae bacterium]|nr:RDD family protein [Ignavibacteriota bacterium]